MIVKHLLVALAIATGIYAQSGDTPAQDPPKAPTGEDRFKGLQSLAEEQYGIWQNTQRAAYVQLRKLQDPCNTKLILKIMEPLKKDAKAYFDKRLEWIGEYTKDRKKALQSAQEFFAGTDPLLKIYDADRENEEKLIADNNDKLKNLPPEEDGARKELEKTIALQQEDLAKIQKNIEERKKVQQSGDSARTKYEAQIQSLDEQMKLVTEDARLAENNYDALIAQYAVACSNIPIRDFRQDDPATAQKPSDSKDVKKKK